MARLASDTLIAAQSLTGGHRHPYIDLVLTSYDGGTTYDLSTAGTFGRRIILVDHTEEPYNEYATVVLRNYDRTLPTDLTGYWTEIGYGDTTAVGNEYLSTARLWVKHHQEVSVAGKLITILELEGAWAKMRETKLRLGSPPYYIADSDLGNFGSTPTVYDIISYVLTNCINPAMTLSALTEDDGIIDTYIPRFTVNDGQPFEDAATVVYRLIKMTKSYLCSRASLTFKVKYPQSADVVNFYFYSNISPKFYEYSERRNLVVPNHLYLFCNAGSDNMWTSIITAEATDTGSVTKYGNTPDVAVAPEIDNQTDADNRAAAILARSIAEGNAGKLVIPHDCRIELYDRIAVGDDRGF